MSSKPKGYSHQDPIFTLIESFGKVIEALGIEGNTESPVPKAGEDLPSIGEETKQSLRDIQELRSDVQELDSHLEEISSKASQFLDDFKQTRNWAEDKKMEMHEIYSKTRRQGGRDSPNKELIPEVEPEVEEGVEDSIENLQNLQVEAARLDKELQEIHELSQEIGQVIEKAASDVEQEVSTIRSLKGKLQNFKNGTLQKIRGM